MVLLAPAAFAANGIALDPSRTLFNARQLGMGGVSVGFANDANGVFANPSGLTGLEFPQVTTSSRRLLMDETQYLLLGWAMPTDYGTFGIGYAGMGTGGSIPTMLDPGTGRIIQNPSLEVGSYSNSVLAFSYAREITTPIKLSAGGNLKFFNQALSGGNASDRGTGTGIDLGVTYRPLFWLTTGAVLQNIIGGSVKWSNSEDKIGGYYKLGAAATVLGPTQEALNYYPQTLRAGLDLDLPSGVLAASNSMLYHLGVEYLPIKNVFLRAGLNQESAGSSLTLGVGVVNGGFRFDYAYDQRPGLPGDSPHYFSLSYIGERVLTIDYKLKKKATVFKFLHPRDKLVTDLDFVHFSAEAWAEKVIDRKRTWTVTAVSATQDVHEITVQEKFALLFLNGKPVAKHGTNEVIEGREDLKHGRNVIQLLGYTSPEIIADTVIPSTVGTGELRILRVTPFTDTPVDFWAADPIYLNVTLGLITGYPDNSFKPDKGITRAELVTLLVKSLSVPQETLDARGSEESFTDVALIHWAAKYIAHGSALKLVSGYPDMTFKPNKVLSRAEGVTILARYAGLKEDAGAAGAPFPDLKPGFWANKYIAPAKAAGMLKYLAGKDFKPSENFTRAEAAEVFYQAPAIQSKVNEFWNTGIVSAASQ